VSTIRQTEQRARSRVIKAAHTENHNTPATENDVSRITYRRSLSHTHCRINANRIRALQPCVTTRNASIAWRTRGQNGGLRRMNRSETSRRRASAHNPYSASVRNGAICRSQALRAAEERERFTSNERVTELPCFYTRNRVPRTIDLIQGSPRSTVPPLPHVATPAQDPQ